MFCRTSLSRGPGDRTGIIPDPGGQQTRTFDSDCRLRPFWVHHGRRHTHRRNHSYRRQLWSPRRQPGPSCPAALLDKPSPGSAPGATRRARLPGGREGAALHALETFPHQGRNPRGLINGTVRLVSHCTYNLVDLERRRFFSSYSRTHGVLTTRTSFSTSVKPTPRIGHP